MSYQWNRKVTSTDFCHVISIGTFSGQFLVLFMFNSGVEEGKLIATTIDTAGGNYNWHELDLGVIADGDAFESYTQAKSSSNLFFGGHTQGYRNSVGDIPLPNTVGFLSKINADFSDIGDDNWQSRGEPSGWSTGLIVQHNVGNRANDISISNSFLALQMFAFSIQFSNLAPAAIVFGLPAATYLETSIHGLNSYTYVLDSSDIEIYYTLGDPALVWDLEVAMTEDGAQCDFSGYAADISWTITISDPEHTALGFFSSPIQYNGPGKWLSIQTDSIDFIRVYQWTFEVKYTYNTVDLATQNKIVKIAIQPKQ